MTGLNGGQIHFKDILTGLLSVLCAILFFQYQFQNNKIWEQGQDLAAIKTNIDNQIEVNRRIERALEAMNDKMVEVLSRIENLKDGVAMDAAATQTLKNEVEIGRQDRITDTAELRKRIEELEKIIEPGPRGR